MSLYKPQVGQCGSNLLFGACHQADKFLGNSGASVGDTKHLF